MVDIIGQMDAIIKVNGLMEKEMDMEKLHILQARLVMVSGKTIKK